MITLVPSRKVNTYFFLSSLHGTQHDTQIATQPLDGPLRSTDAVRRHERDLARLDESFRPLEDSEAEEVEQ